MYLLSISVEIAQRVAFYLLPNTSFLKFNKEIHKINLEHTMVPVICLHLLLFYLFNTFT